MQSTTPDSRSRLLNRLESLTLDRFRIEEQILTVMESLHDLANPSLENSTQADSGVPVPNPEANPTPEQEAPQEANAEATEGKSSSSLDSHSLPISVLKLARGWEEKLSAAGVSTVADLGEYISDGCLKPGCLPRVGPEAVEKIRAAYQEYTGTTLPPSAGRSTPASDPAPTSTPTPEPTSDACYAEGKRFAEAGAKAFVNPHPKGTALWASWDRGWQETFAVMEANDLEEEVDSVEPAASPALAPTPEPAPTSSPGIPDLDLSPAPAPTSPAPAVEDEFDDL